MKLRRLSYALLVGVTVVGLVSLLGLFLGLTQWPRQSIGVKLLLAQAHRPGQQNIPPVELPTPQVVVGTPEFYNRPINNRYTYRNERPQDRTKLRTLYLIDTQTGQETRMGDDSHAALFGTLNETHLLWFFDNGLYAYQLATNENRLVAKPVSYSLHPQIVDDWVAFGKSNGGGTRLATLSVANLHTQEIITLTKILSDRDAAVNGYFGISSRLAAWYEPLNTIVVYDLNAHTELARLTNVNAVFDEQYLDVYDLTPGETVVTWSRNYGYDLVTRSYFRIERSKPPTWDKQPIFDTEPIREQGRMLFWTYHMQDGTQRHVRAPLLDATPSITPCLTGQNLVQNSDLESVVEHTRWQQSGSSSNLIVNELPPNAPQGGQWAIRLGRYNNAQPAIQQTLDIPSGVQGITLTFDVRANSWDLWGGDQLQVDLIDPTTATSLLETPVQWTNVQLAAGGWVPLQVAIQAWPGIDTPLQLVFRAQTDWAFPTDFTIDNIRFITSCQ